MLKYIHTCINTYIVEVEKNECLSLYDSLHIYTRGAAYAMFAENSLGQIKAGFSADFIILNKNIIKDPSLLKNAIVNQVYVAGHTHYDVNVSNENINSEKRPLNPGKNGPPQRQFRCPCCV